MRLARDARGLERFLFSCGYANARRCGPYSARTESPRSAVPEKVPTRPGEAAPSILSGEMAIGVEPCCPYFRGARRIGPLNPAMALDELVRESGIIAEAARRYLLPFVEGILRLSPSRKEFPVAA